MFIDWLRAEGGALLSWWLLVLLAGWGVYPILYRVMSSTPSRGYPLARAAGLLLVGFLYWILNSIGWLQNETGSIVVAWLIVVGFSILAYFTWPERPPIGKWIQQNIGLIAATEALFILMFVGWAIVRALNPDLGGTEKPMEMAFLSATRRSAALPPNDPWMSGYAISYYYLGYVIMAMLAMFSNVTNGAAFNLSISLLFALAGISVFGVAFDLVAWQVRRNKERENPVSTVPVAPRTGHGSGIAAGTLAAFLLVFMGNFGMTMVEVPYQAGLIDPSGGYMRWIDLQHRPTEIRGCPPNDARSLNPNDWCFLWWWGYSRVVQDRGLSGEFLNDVITEFPQFSFILADIHPHVLALPLGALMIGLSFAHVTRKRPARLWEIVLYAVFFGGMIFLNTWDTVFLGVIIGAEALRRLMNNGTGKLIREDWGGIAWFAVRLLLLIAVFYAPFFIGFRSQAGGPLPSVIWTTRIQQFVMMFAPFILLILPFLFQEARRAGSRMNWAFAIRGVITTLVLLAIGFVAIAVFAWSRPEIRQAVFRTFDVSGGVGSLIPFILGRRLEGAITHTLLFGIITVVLARLFARAPTREDGSPAASDTVIDYSPATGFALLIIAAGAVLTVTPDFVYLRDGFGTRINMIFKLYYQTWSLWSVAGAFCAWSLFNEAGYARAIGDKVKEQAALWKPTPQPRLLFGFLLAFVIITGSFYPLAAIHTRAMKESGRIVATENPTPMTLDGGVSLAYSADDYAAIQCLGNTAKAPDDVVAEAVRPGLAYNSRFGRVSGLTGIPTLMGWDNHQRQWRGNTYEEALNTLTPTGATESRFDAIAILYNTTDWATAQDIINRYGITYIYVGPTERYERVDDNGTTRPLFDAAGLAKFDGLTPVCQFGDAAVYSVDSLPTANTLALR